MATDQVATYGGCTGPVGCAGFPQCIIAHDDAPTPSVVSGRTINALPVFQVSVPSQSTACPRSANVSPLSVCWVTRRPITTLLCLLALSRGSLVVPKDCSTLVASECDRTTDTLSHHDSRSRDADTRICHSGTMRLILFGRSLNTG